MTPPSASSLPPADASGEPAGLDAGARALLDAVPGNVAVLDATGRIVHTNAAWEAFALAGDGTVGCGTGVDYLAVCRAAAAAGEEAAGRALAAIMTVLERGGASEPFTYLCETPAGARWFLMTVAWWPDLPGAVVAHVDVTESKVAQAASEASLRAVSHDLRGPLTSIIGMGRLLQARADRLSQDQRDELLSRLLSAAHRLEHDLENLTALDRLDAGDWRPRPVTTDVDALVRELVDELDLPPERVSVEIPRGLTCGIDAPWLERVIVNLVTNGVRHTPASASVTVRAAVEGERLVLVVEDDGPGIPASERERVLEAFERADATAPGSGLGLSIVARFTALLDGELDVGERPGGGARFTVRIPVTTAETDGAETVR